MARRSSAASITGLAAANSSRITALPTSGRISVGRLLRSDGAALDLCYLHELGGSALLPLARLERQAAPGEFRTRVSRVRMRVQWTVERDLSQGEWSWLAERRLAQVHRELGAGARLAPMLPYNCEGVAIEPEPLVDAATSAIPSPGLTGGEER